MESNLITLEEEVFGILSEEKIDTRPLAPSLSLLPLSSPLFLSFSRAAPLRSCCTSNSSNYCYDSDEGREEWGPPTDSVGYSLLSPVFPFSIPKFILIYASFPPWGSELEKEATPDPNSPLRSPTSRISVVF